MEIVYNYTLRSQGWAGGDSADHPYRLLAFRTQTHTHFVRFVVVVVVVGARRNQKACNGFWFHNCVGSFHFVSFRSVVRPMPAASLCGA